MKVYVVNIKTSSPNYQNQTEELSDFQTKTTFKYDKKTRQKIASVRARAKKPLYDMTLDFHGIRIAREDVIWGLEKVAAKADAEMREIDEPLYARFAMAPLNMDEVKAGDLYATVLSAIRYNIFKKVFDRVTEIIQKNKSVTDATRGSLFRLFDQLRNLNVLDDEEINKQIESIRKQVEATKLEDIAKDMQREIDALETRGGRVKVKAAEPQQQPAEQQPGAQGPARAINVAPTADVKTSIPNKIEPSRGEHIVAGTPTATE